VSDDPGNAWAQKPLSVRLKQIRTQWINLGQRQLLMLDNFILSAEYLEEQLAMKNEPKRCKDCEKEYPCGEHRG